MKIRPLQDRIIVKRIEEEDKTKGGIIIPDSAREKPMEGEVIAVGTGKILENGKKQPLEVYCHVSTHSGSIQYCRSTSPDCGHCRKGWFKPLNIVRAGVKSK